ncbi:MAG TPA: helix-turn-helix domain-containing protein [Gemmataceae bacterium]|nr:helix-turn-helix domain-containing protein [Gemmataceae bacterium]
MCRTRTLTLTPARRRTLIHVRDHDPTPYLRERAAALLKVADGWTVKDVAALGLLAPRSANTVAEWVTRYERGGIRSLRIRPGRGRTPAFSPLRADPGSGPCRTP